MQIDAMLAQIVKDFTGFHRLAYNDENASTNEE